MRILRGLLIALSVLFLLATIGIPFGVSFAFRGWYVDGGAAKVEAAQKESDQKLAELKKTMGGRVSAALQKELDDGMAREKEMFGIAKTMANWELTMMLVGFGVLVSLFFSKRLIPLSASGLLILVAILAIAMVPDIKLGLGQTSGFEIKAHGVCAIIASVFGILASLIGLKKATA
jgi:hypothetical protein